MAVEGVIFDVSDTLITRTGHAVEDIVDAVDRLRAMGVQIIAVHNDPPRASVASQLAHAGVPVDHVFTQQEAGKAKGSPVWIDLIKRETGLQTNELLYVGDSHWDMITATRGPLVYCHAEWAAPRGQYGIPAPAPGWVPAVVEHIFRKQHRWYWTLDTTDTAGRRVRKMALIDGNGAGDDVLKSNLIDLLKREIPATVGQMLLRDFVMLHLIASLYEEGLTSESGWWTTYPSSTGSRNTVMGDFLNIAAKLFRRTYKPDLLIRHTPALKSKQAYDQGGMEGAFRNQLDTMRLGPVASKEVSRNSVLLVDNFLTRGVTTEVGRCLLTVAGSPEVVTVAVGKYGASTNILIPPDSVRWDPHSAAHPDLAAFKYYSVSGQVNHQALAEFVASHHAMRSERW
jgi:soluble P-type ATPase